jgi:hypothetical protein
MSSAFKLLSFSLKVMALLNPNVYPVAAKLISSKVYLPVVSSKTINQKQQN